MTLEIGEQYELVNIDEVCATDDSLRQYFREEGISLEEGDIVTITSFEPIRNDGYFRVKVEECNRTFIVYVDELICFEPVATKVKREKYTIWR